MSNKPNSAPHTIGPTDAGQRLDRYLKRVCTNIPFVGLQKAIRMGTVKVNGRKAPPDFRLQVRDVVTLPPSLGHAVPQQTSYTPSKAELAALQKCVVHEDAQLLAFNKPQGLPAQAGGGQVKSLDRLLAAQYGTAHAPKLVHRLDKETTGLILSAKNRTTAAQLSAQWASRSVLKGYLALVLAKKLPAQGALTESIGKRGPVAVIDEQNGDAATTRYINLGEVQTGVWAVLALPYTGRMNQIRVHFAHHGWPLVGDDKYGDFAHTKPMGKQLGTGLALHAWCLQLAHPQTGVELVLTAPLPAAWQPILTSNPELLARATTAWQTCLTDKTG